MAKESKNSTAGGRKRGDSGNDSEQETVESTAVELDAADFDDGSAAPKHGFFTRLYEK